VDPSMNVRRNLRDPQGWNRYAYARNNPLNRVDPDGRDWWFAVGLSPEAREALRVAIARAVQHEGAREVFLSLAQSPRVLEVTNVRLQGPGEQNVTARTLYPAGGRPTVVQMDTAKIGAIHPVDKQGGYTFSHELLHAQESINPAVSFAHWQTGDVAPPGLAQGRADVFATGQYLTAPSLSFDDALHLVDQTMRVPLTSRDVRVGPVITPW